MEFDLAAALAPDNTSSAPQAVGVESDPFAAQQVLPLGGSRFEGSDLPQDRKRRDLVAMFEREAKKREEDLVRPKRKGHTKFSTQYGIEWGRRQGWKLIDRERFDFRLKQHHDLELGVDAIFDDLVSGRVGVQAAGRSERAEHYRRFLERGGPETARRRNLRVVYVEFVRGQKDPVVIEWWASS